MYYVLILLVAGIVVAVQYNKNGDLQTKADTLTQLVSSANDATARAVAQLQDTEKHYQGFIDGDNKTIADLHEQMSKIDLRPQITLPPVIQRTAEVVRVQLPPPPPPSPPPAPPPAPTIDVAAAQYELSSVESKINNLEQDKGALGKELHNEGSNSNYNSGSGIYSHGGASDKIADDDKQLSVLRARKAVLLSELRQQSANTPAATQTTAAPANNLSSGSLDSSVLTP
jgi:hypothetical protein